MMKLLFTQRRRALIVPVAAIAALAGLSSKAAVAQGRSSVQITLTEQGMPVAGALVVLQRLKDSDCAKRFKNPDLPADDIRKLKTCMTDLPDAATDAKGRFTYELLTPGWYDLRFLWSMQKPPAPDSAIACMTQDWVVFYEPGRDRTGKYDAMAQGIPFELKEGETRQIAFDYRDQFEAATCKRRVANVKTSGNRGLARLSIPGQHGVLEIDPGETAWTTELRQAGKEIYFSAMGRRDHVLVTAFLSQVPFAATPEKCRDARWREEEKRLRSHDVDLGHVKKSTENGTARVEFFIERGPGGRLEMEDVHAFMGSGGLCAEVHLSKVLYRAEERKLFDDVLSTVRFLPDEPAERQSNPQ